MSGYAKVSSGLKAWLSEKSQAFYCAQVCYVQGSPKGIPRSLRLAVISKDGQPTALFVTKSDDTG